MKSLREYLTEEGRLDVLAKVMPYRGGQSYFGCLLALQLITLHI